MLGFRALGGGPSIWDSHLLDPTLGRGPNRWDFQPFKGVQLGGTEQCSGSGEDGLIVDFSNGGSVLRCGQSYGDHYLSILLDLNEIKR